MSSPHASRYFRIDDPYIESYSFKRRFPRRPFKWDYVQARWWSRMYEYRWLLDVASECREKHSARTALDAASGTEHTGCFILSNLKYEMVTAQDVESRHPMIEKSTKSNIKYLRNDLSEPSDEAYSLVCCISALEHMPPDTQRVVLSNLCDAVEPGGALLITLDVPGFDSKTDLDLYREIITAKGLEFDEESVPEKERLSSKNGRLRHDSGWPDKGIDVAYVYRFFATRPAG